MKIGLVISLLVQPFEVIRTTSIMSKKTRNINLSGTIFTVKDIFQTEGIRGFFRGGLLSMCKSTLSAALFFTGLENAHVMTNSLRERIKDYWFIPTNFIDFCNACASKTITTCVISPFNVLKTRFEVVGVNEYTNIRSAVSSIYNKEGTRGFYKGLLATLFRDVPYSGIQYSCYRFLLDLYSDYVLKGEDAKKSSAVVFFIGGISSIYAVMLTYPFDNLRVRYQCSDFANFNGSMRGLQGFQHLIQDVYKTEGVKGFYAGYIPRLMKKALSSALVWTLYERLRKKERNNRAQ